MKKLRNLRAWDISRKEMRDIRGYADNEQTIKVFNMDGGFCSYPKDNILILEGTGQMDINGNEIFEDDLISARNPDVKDALIRTPKIFYQDGGYYITPVDPLSEWVLVCYLEIKHWNMEIIGNIHQNKDLILKIT